MKDEKWGLSQRFNSLRKPRICVMRVCPRAMRLVTDIPVRLKIDFYYHGDSEVW